jgi:hypothetical protein
MKRTTALLLLFVLAAALVAYGLSTGGSDDGETIVRPEQPPPDAPPLRHEDVPDVPEDAPEPTLRGDAEEIPGEAETTPGETLPEAPQPPAPSEDVAAVYEGEVPDGWHEAPAAQRPHAIRPPRPRGPRMSPGGSSGGMGPTGHWSRFPPPPPPKGTAALHVIVLDEKGARVVGADVYLGPRESLHQPAVSFGDLRKLGKTDASGELLVPDLPAGAAVVAGNLQNILNGPRGLDARSSVPVLLISRARVRATVRLPIDVAGFGSLAGRVVDAKERPVGRAEIRCGFVRVYADADGRFEMPAVHSGPQRVSALRSGYTPATVAVDVPRGGRKEVEIVLTFRESGTLHLEGRVLDAGGGPVEAATLYLIDEGGRGTLRSVKTDANGDYLFEDLPDRLRTSPSRLQVDKFREGYPATIVRFESGITDTHLDVTLPPRRTKVRFVLRDAGNGEPITRCRIEPERLDDPSTNVRGFLGSDAEGVFERYFDAGHYRFTVEAPDHQTRTVEADLVEAGDVVELQVHLPAAGPDSVQVTLKVTVVDAVTGAPVTSCTILVLEPQTEDEVARFSGRAEDGKYSMPAPSGARTVRVTAPGYEQAEEGVELPADPPEADLTIHMRPQ